MKKIVTIGYDEHEEMKKVMETQAKLINEMKKKDNVVVLTAGTYHFGLSVPSIRYTGKDKAIKGLTSSYEQLRDDLYELRRGFENHSMEKRKEIRDALNTKKSTWWDW